MFLDMLDSNIIVYTALAIGVGVLVLELVSRIYSLAVKKAVLALLSVLLLAWLDIWSCLILTALATGLFVLIKKQVTITKVRFIVFLVAFIVLIALKDHSVILDLENPYRPLGVSFYFFRMISLFIEYSRKPERFYGIDAIHFYCFAFFFPLILAGPIQRFHDFKDLDPHYVMDNKLKQYWIIVTSLMAKLIFVDAILHHLVYREMNYVVHPGEPYVSFVSLCLYGFLAFLHAYLDLMLYTRISNACSVIFGFTHQINFNKPLLASNIAQFWQRWHISLSSWVRDYIFFPVLVKTRRTWIASYAALFIIAIWHSFTLSWIFWGFAHGTALNLYSLLRKSGLYQKLSDTQYGPAFLRVTGTALTIFFVSFIFIFVARQDFFGTLVIFKKMIMR